MYVPFENLPEESKIWIYQSNRKFSDDEFAEIEEGLKNYLQDCVETIYFGGGTPSLIGYDALKKIFETLYKNYSISPSTEITLEANPDDITAESLSQWKALGINRLSIGIQSFFEKHLQWMNRSHSAMQAENCIKLALEAGFKNFSIDLNK